jgi:hypothetical protein
MRNDEIVPWLEQLVSEMQGRKRNPSTTNREEVAEHERLAQRWCSEATRACGKKGDATR